MTVHTGISRRSLSVLVLLVATSFGALAAVPPLPRASASTCGKVQVPGHQWLSGAGVDVHSNGGSQQTGNSCGNGGHEIYNLNAPTPVYGFAWQCVELVNRLYATKGWYKRLTLGPDTNGGAKYLYTYASQGRYPGLIAHANGSGYKPIAGDMVVHRNGTYGHVAIVDSVSGSTLRAVEQNASNSGRSSYRYNPTTGAVSKPGAIIAGYIHAQKNKPSRVIDFTGDGKADVAWYEQWQNAITVLKANAKGNGFTSAWKHSGIGGPTWAGVGDFTGDGKADVAWYERWQNAITVLKSTGDGFTPAWKLNGVGGPTWAGVGDFTGDGKADIAWYEQWQNAITVLKSTGRGFSLATWKSRIGAPSWAAAGDFTGDGRADVAWYEQWQDAITVMKSTGRGFAGAWKRTGVGSPTWAGVGDFTGDGKADIAWYEQWQNAITVLRSTGRGFIGAWKSDGIGGPTWAGVGDFTGDGKADVAWYEQWQNAITVLKSTGRGFIGAWKNDGIGGPTWAGVT